VHIGSVVDAKLRFRTFYRPGECVLTHNSDWREDDADSGGSVMSVGQKDVSLNFIFAADTDVVFELCQNPNTLTPRQGRRRLVRR